MNSFSHALFFSLLCMALAMGCSETSPAPGSESGGGGGFGGSSGGGAAGGGATGETGVDTGETGESTGEGTGGGNGLACQDQDEDGYGTNCLPGPDCDDSNPNFQSDCADCTSSQHEGCPCAEAGVTKLCYGADPNLDGKGECQVGERSCIDGYWTGCVGEVLPAPEVCDYLDNNCDGTVDEGVKSPCGDCDKFCEVEKLGAGTASPFELKDDDSEAVEVTPEGWVTLSDNSFALHYIWIANSGESTVSKLDTITGQELGRYYVCPDPSRTSVDQSGDCWVGCRGNGEVAKITNFVDSCVDKDGNGVIETSYDANGDGTIQGGEMFTNSQGMDECVAFVVKPSGASLIRAVGVDKSNHAWVGDWNNQKLYRLSPTDGSTVQTIQMGSSPYGLAIDGDGIVWVAGRGGAQGLVRVDPGNGSVQVLSPPQGVEPYGIIVAPNNDIWIGNCCSAHVAWRYNPPSGGWTSIPVSNRPRGVAASQDGHVYVANDQTDRVAKINLATMQVVGYAELGGGRFPVGVAVDGQGYVWAVNQSTSSATKIDPVTMQVVLEQPVGTSPYTYSDMTGASFFNDIAPEGFFEPIYSGDADARVRWKSLNVVYDAPAGTWIDVRFRMSDDLEELKTTPWTAFVGPFPPESFPLDLTQILKKKATHLQLHIALYTANTEVKPVVKTIKLEYSSE